MRRGLEAASVFLEIQLHNFLYEDAHSPELRKVEMVLNWWLSPRLQMPGSPKWLLLQTCDDIVYIRVSTCDDTVYSHVSTCDDTVYNRVSTCIDTVYSRVSVCDDTVYSCVSVCNDTVYSRVSVTGAERRTHC